MSTVDHRDINYITSTTGSDDPAGVIISGISGYSGSQGLTVGGIGYPYTSVPNTWATGTSAVSNSVSGELTINGDSPDIKLGDRSLRDFMDKVEERLGILRPNEALEERWEKLKDLRRQYNELEKELIEKEKMWDILKKE